MRVRRQILILVTGWMPFCGIGALADAGMVSASGRPAGHDGEFERYWRQFQHDLRFENISDLSAHLDFETGSFSQRVGRWSGEFDFRKCFPEQAREELLQSQANQFRWKPAAGNPLPGREGFAIQVFVKSEWSFIYIFTKDRSGRYRLACLFDI